MNTLERIQAHMKSFSSAFPGCWKTMEAIRHGKGHAFLQWPSWCFLPIAAGMATVTENHDYKSMSIMEKSLAASMASSLTALATWRMTQGIYRFQPDMLDAVWETPLDAEIPVELFFRLPEWCMYIETPGRKHMNLGVQNGFFVFLEHDVNNSRKELRLVFDVGEKPKLVGMPLHLSENTIQASINSVVDSTTNEIVKQLGLPDNIANNALQGVSLDHLREIATPAVSLVLYICSLNAEMRDACGSSRSPGRPRPTKTRSGPRWFPAEQPTVWETGWRTGAALQKAREARQATEPQGGTHASPLPHIRKAHWHSFWTGPRNEPERQRIVVKWLPPIPVNVEDDLPATLHVVK